MASFSGFEAHPAQKGVSGELSSICCDAIYSAGTALQCIVAHGFHASDSYVALQYERHKATIGPNGQERSPDATGWPLCRHSDCGRVNAASAKSARALYQLISNSLETSSVLC
ncbi:MAG: hypothetical protein WB772_00590, partial [Xanthobacteraceae bacterium]